METLIVLGSIASYFLVGMVAGRIVFALTLRGDSRQAHDVTNPDELRLCRKMSRLGYKPENDGCYHKTRAYDSALWGLLLMVFLWPLITVLFIIFVSGEKLFKLLTRETKPERQCRLEREKRELELEIAKEAERTRRLAEQMNLPVVGD